METFHMKHEDQALQRYETSSVQAAAEESWILHPLSGGVP